MLNALKNESNKTFTENGAVTNTSTMSDCLDLFATIGALRNASEKEITDRFIRAYTENPDTAMKILFFARDIRGGLGERKVFRTVMNYLASNEPCSVRKNIEFFAEYGRYDDLLALFGTKCEKEMLEYIAVQFFADLKALEEDGTVSLLAKWLPSVNASNNHAICQAKRIARSLNLSDADYRKALTSLRARIRLIENNLREKDYSFDYEKQPSKAMFKYRAAFMRNDKDRYNQFLHKAVSGEAKLHADTLMPYEIIKPCLDYRYLGHSFAIDLPEEEKQALNATWASLPDYGMEGNALAVVDTSGSMYCGGSPMPATVALSLGLYFAERNKGIFHNHFIEFSAKPQLYEIKGETFADKVRYIASFNEIANTNIEAVFDLILNTAVKNNVPQKELPSTIYIISDMEFDRCVENASISNFENAKRKFQEHCYTLPNVVFWNVASRNRQQPVTMNEQGVALVSGCTPKLFSMVASGNLNPYEFMMDVIASKRYEVIAA